MITTSPPVCNFMPLSKQQNDRHHTDKRLVRDPFLTSTITHPSYSTPEAGKTWFSLCKFTRLRPDCALSSARFLATSVRNACSSCRRSNSSQEALLSCSRCVPDALLGLHLLNCCLQVRATDVKRLLKDMHAARGAPPKRFIPSPMPSPQTQCSHSRTQHGLVLE